MESRCTPILSILRKILDAFRRNQKLSPETPVPAEPVPALEPSTPVVTPVPALEPVKPPEPVVTPVPSTPMTIRPLTLDEQAYFDYWGRIPFSMPFLLNQIKKWGYIGVVVNFEKDVTLDITDDLLMKVFSTSRDILHEWLECMLGYNGFGESLPEVRLFGVRTYASLKNRFDTDVFPRVIIETDDSVDSWSGAFRAWGADKYWVNLDPIRPNGPIRTLDPDHYDLILSVTGHTWLANGIWHYARCSQNIWTEPRRLGVLYHEFGHVFGLDDLYDSKKYPERLPEGGEKFKVDSVMLNASNARVFPFDQMSVRYIWDKYCLSSSRSLPFYTERPLCSLEHP